MRVNDIMWLVYKVNFTDTIWATETTRIKLSYIMEVVGGVFEDEGGCDLYQ